MTPEKVTHAHNRERVPLNGLDHRLCACMVTSPQNLLTLFSSFSKTRNRRRLALNVKVQSNLATSLLHKSTSAYFCWADHDASESLHLPGFISNLSMQKYLDSLNHGRKYLALVPRIRYTLLLCAYTYTGTSLAPWLHLDESVSSSGKQVPA